jgi:hypothetical protein
MSTLDKQKIVDELTAEWLPKVAKADREETKQLIGALVTSWLSEAIGSVTGAEAVNEIQREDLASLLANAKTPAARIEALRGMVLRRRVNEVSAATFKLGMQVVDGEKNDATARAEGKRLQTQIDELAGHVNALGDSGTKRNLQREISEMAMEVLYAIERKAMSLRLNRYQQTRRQ